LVEVDVNHVLDRPRRRLRGETVGVILLTALLAIGATTMTVVAVTLSSSAPTIGAMIR
jgi:hypothetical protein